MPSSSSDPLTATETRHEPYRRAAMAPSNDDAAKAVEAQRLVEEDARHDAEARDHAKEAANATLHTQAIAILVPVTSEKPADDYDYWRSLFLIVLGMYNLKDHMLSDDS